MAANFKSVRSESRVRSVYISMSFLVSKWVCEGLLAPVGAQTERRGRNQPVESQMLVRVSKTVS